MTRTIDIWARSVSRFLSWWGRTLLSLIPQSTRQRLKPTPPTLVLDLDESDVVLSLFARRSRRDLGRFPVAKHDAADMRIALTEALKRVKLGKTRVAVRLPARKAVHRLLTLPSKLEADLDQAMIFQIDRMTPFAQDQIYYDYRIIDRASSPNQITVELTAVPRLFVDRAVAAVRSWGLEPRVVDITDKGPPAPPCRNLLTGEKSREPGSLWSPLNRTLAAVVLLLLATVSVLPLAKGAAQADHLRKEVALARAASEQVLELRERLSQAERRAGFVAGQRTALPSLVAALEQLTRALPDDSWVFQLEIKGHEVGIRGYGRDAAALIPLLAAEQGFHRPRFRAPVVKDLATGLDQFDLAVGLTP